MMTEIRSVADIPPIDRDQSKPTIRTLADFTEAELRQYGQQANAHPPIPASSVPPATGDEWRPLLAQFGRCDGCGKMFGLGELLLWNVHTKLTLHPRCCSDPTVRFRPVRAVRQGLQNV